MKIVNQEIICYPTRAEVFYKGNTVHLTLMPYRLLLIFLNNPDTILPYPVLYKRLFNFNPDTKTMRNYVSTMVYTLRQNFDHNIIITKQGFGYFMPRGEDYDIDTNLSDYDFMR